MKNFLIPLIILMAFPLAVFGDDEPPAPAERGPKAKEFYRLQAEMNSLVAQFATLQLESRTASEDQQEQILLKWKQLVERGEEIEPQWIAAAKEAYEESPNTDKNIVFFLGQLLLHDINRDDYENAYDLGRVLMENNCKFADIANAAGVAAFITNHLDDAKKYLSRANEQGYYKNLKEKNKLGMLGNSYLLSLPAYKEMWRREKAIRERQAESDNLPRVLLKTSKGDITFELFENEAPNTVANFISLVEAGFYDGLTFHRVMPGFMAQGGCPRGDGSGGPGYKIPCECYKQNQRLHFRGSLSMAHRGQDTGGSQFFLTFGPTFHLNHKHTVFGRVIDGMDVLTKLQRRDPDDKEAPRADKIIKAEVIRKRPHEYKPEKMPE